MNGFGWFFLGLWLGTIVTAIATVGVLARAEWKEETGWDDPDPDDGEPLPVENNPPPALRVVA